MTALQPNASPKHSELEIYPTVTTKPNDRIVVEKTMNDTTCEVAPEEADSSEGLTILFLSSDTGGGHRASAESLAKQFELQFPGSTYHLLDVMKDHGTPPYNSLIETYKHLSAHPTQWKAVYGISNTRPFEMLTDVHLKLMCERAVRNRIKSYNPDVVVSVHPLMTNVPVLSCQKISQESGKHLPIFTVVTDLGSAHCQWFCNGVEKMFIGSEQIRILAKARGKVPDEKLIMAGLPIRHDFSLQANSLGDRMSEQGKEYQMKVRENLGLEEPGLKTILVMGGGEGVGSLSNIVDALYVEFTNRGIDAVILVVCGRNEKLKELIETKDWKDVLIRRDEILSEGSNSCWGTATGGQLAQVVGGGCLDSSMTSRLRKILSSSSLTMESAVSTILHDERIQDFEKIIPAVLKPKKTNNIEDHSLFDDSMGVIDAVPHGKVKVVGLGFVTRMAEYMVAADVLVSKAGPGTIAEAASLGLPIMLTSFLPGQEEGNVKFVVDGQFGAFCPDTDPPSIADIVSQWLLDEGKLKAMSEAAKLKGAPNAAADIVKHIGESSLRWKKLNMSTVAESSSVVWKDSGDSSESNAVPV